MKEKLLRAIEKKVKGIMANLTKLDWEEYKNFDLKRIFEMLDCEWKEVFRLDKERIIVCRSWFPVDVFGNLPYGCNTQINVLSLVNLKTGYRKEVDWFYWSQWDSYSKRFRSSQEWIHHCLEAGKMR